MVKSIGASATIARSQVQPRHVNTPLLAVDDRDDRDHADRNLTTTRSQQLPRTLHVLNGSLDALMVLLTLALQNLLVWSHPSAALPRDGSRLRSSALSAA